MIESHFIAESPESVGIDAEKLAALFARAAKEVDEGLLPACQIAIARKGQIAGIASFGSATEESLFNVFSSTKAITSAAGWLVMQDGKLNVNERVADIVPEFGTHGKEAITVEQLFTHTAGFPHAPFRVDEWFNHERRLERFSEWTLNWPVGSRFEYHPTSSMYVIAEIIERRSGIAFDEFVRQRISKPLGLPDMFLGCPPQQHHRIIPVTHVGDALTAADYAALGVPMPPVTEVTEDALTAFNSTEARQVPVPGGGGIMSAADLALFYQALLNGGRALGGEQIWREQTLNEALKVRNHFPDLLGTPVNRALGVVVAGDEHRNGRGFGHTNSPLAFGHGGAGGQLAWGDPATGISLGYCTSGHDRNVIRQARRGIGISSRAASCAA
ncbi:MAG: serine hydrolase [Proteobacteria bacterium]|nr:serine hydrolase [Pseudomonadota bacterium]